MKHYVTLAFVVALMTANGWAEAPQRAWQKGTWVAVQTTRPRFAFGVGRDPRAGAPPPPVAEVRTYVIETDDLRLELKENTTVGARRIDASIEEPVTFALEKNTVYIKLPDGGEHKLTVTKKTPKTKP